ncbi:site-specific DNA-methyltransferase [Micromonospora sp. NBC_01655]|uniref:DNA methyltransferase n=1 Tax=Micromonospora sp. NBC_01655 TaxID=2975983 RepID=UPI002251E1C7|nr:DNA methyltransferase [Micromonospora sp. NBC_01655]MCX4469100.1 site-specific DNA-methyltransferase [Micromonospora sp. NBC_01655]
MTEAVPSERSPRAAGEPLPVVPASGQGRSHGTSSSEAFDRWFRYPAGFASDYVSLLLSRLEIPARSVIVDPFAGSGVTGTSARRMNYSFFGIEAHPAIAELAVLKLQPAPRDASELTKVGMRLTEHAQRVADEVSRVAKPETDLIRRCFTPDVLAQLVSVRELIKGGEAGDWYLHAKWALLSTLRDVAAVRVGWPYQNPTKVRKPRFTDPLSRFRQRLEWMRDDLVTAESQPSDDLELQVVHGDSTDQRSWDSLDPGSAHGCVSSPPYLNNFDYADATRLEMYFWGDISNWAEMCTTIRSKMITATTQQSSVGAALAANESLEDYGDVSKRISDVTDDLKNERLARKRGKEYDRVVPDYFSAIGKVLTNLFAALEPGAPVVWLVGDSAPYGVYVDTPSIIAELAEHVGFIAEDDRPLRRRGQRWAQNTTRHQVELSERLLTLRR